MDPSKTYAIESLMEFLATLRRSETVELSIGCLESWIHDGQIGVRGIKYYRGSSGNFASLGTVVLHFMLTYEDDRLIPELPRKTVESLFILFRMNQQVRLPAATVAALVEEELRELRG